MSLKHGDDTRPWISMCRRAESVECSYETLVTLLTARDKLEMVANVNRTINREVMDITKSAKQVFEALQGVNTPTMQLVAPSYYLLIKLLQAVPRETKPSAKFRQYMAKYMDDKFWTSIKAMHWIASFLDPSFKNLAFVPQDTTNNVNFKRGLLHDLDGWILSEMRPVAKMITERIAVGSSTSG